MTDQPIVAAPPVQGGAIVSLKNLPPNMTMGQLVNAGSGKRYERIWRIVPGQPTDAKNRAASGKFYLTRTVKDKNDPNKTVIENSLGIAAQINVIPLAYNLDRELGTYDEDTNTYTQRCHSNNFRDPDVRYKGKKIAGEAGQIADKCSEVRLKTYKATGEPILDDNGNEQYYLHILCPLARFGAPKTEGGKATKPKCSEVYTIYVAVKAPFTDPADATKTIEKWVCAEINMRVMQAALGAKIVARLGALEAQKKPLSTYPLRLSLSEYTQAGSIKNSFVGVLLDVETPQGVITPEEFEACSAQAVDTKQQRKKWSEYDPDAKDDDDDTDKANQPPQSQVNPPQQTIPSQPATTAPESKGQEITVAPTKTETVATEPVTQPAPKVPDLLF